MTTAERRALVDVIDEHQVTTIEDQTMAELLVDLLETPPLASFTESAPVIRMGRSANSSGPACGSAGFAHRRM